MFNRKHGRQGKVIGLSPLPPCQSSLRLHALRSNVISKIWKSSFERCLHLPNLVNYRWGANSEIEWIVQAFPSKLENLLTELEEETTVVAGIDILQ